jgi:hypothetical protein
MTPVTQITAMEELGKSAFSDERFALRAAGGNVSAAAVLT